MKKRFFNMIFFCIMLLLLLFIVLKNINSLNGLVVVGDEYGYWANVAFLGKLDWSDVNNVSLAILFLNLCLPNFCILLNFIFGIRTLFLE